ncbi:radical SAM protein [Howardella ureilytica]
MHFSCGIVRPPYEAGSCFLQVTSGCSHNKCRFCTFYKEAPFSVSPESEIREDLQEIRDSGRKVKRIFLQGADPFLLSYDRLKRIMDLIKEYLPWGVSVGGYGRVDSVKNKSVEQLKSLKEMGYDMIVFGIESGDDAVLDKMNKGYHAGDIVEQLSKMDEAGMHYSVIFLYGLGGHDYGMGHALKTAEVLNKLSPVRVLASGLSIFPDTPLMEEVRKGEFCEATETEKIMELSAFVGALEINTILDATNVSNMAPVFGCLPDDKDAILEKLRNTIEMAGEERLRNHRKNMRSL